MKIGELKIRLLIKDKNGEIRTNGIIYYTKKYEDKKNNKFNVAFIGGLSVTKGAEIAYQLIKNSSKDFNWFIFGEIGFEKLRELKQDNLIKTGEYERNEIKMLIESCNIDLVCILPIIPETFCYTLSEAILCGVPVLVTEIGALKERMAKMKCGWSVPANYSWEEILSKIEMISKDRNQYNHIKSVLKKSKLSNVKEMTNKYKRLYEKFPSVIYNIDAEEYVEKKKYIEEFNKNNFIVKANNEFEMNQLRILRDESIRLHNIENSITYNLALKIARFHFPGKMKFRSLLYKWKNKHR